MQNFSIYEEKNCVGTLIKQNFNKNEIFKYEKLFLGRKANMKRAFLLFDVKLLMKFD